MPKTHTIGAATVPPLHTHTATLPPTVPPALLMTAEEAAHQIYRVSERRFHEMRQAGLVPAPVVLGPRALRWVRTECEQHALTSLPRLQAPNPAPPRLAAGQALARERRALAVQPAEA